MRHQISRLVRLIAFVCLPSMAVWLAYVGLGLAQKSRIEAPVRVLDLEPIVSTGESLPLRFSSIRVNTMGLFIWTEFGASPLAGTRHVAVHHLSESGQVLGSISLPKGTRLTKPGDFGLDSAGNVYALLTRRSRSADLDEVFLIKVDSRGETLGEFELPGMPASFAVGASGRVSLLSSEASISSPEAPTVAVAQGYSPRSDFTGAPPRWWPLLEHTPGGLLLIDGLSGTTQKLSALPPEEPRAIPSERLLAAVRHLQEAHAPEGPVPAAGKSFSFRPALRGSSCDEEGNLYFTLMGTRPSDGIEIIRIDSWGRVKPSLYLGAPLDKNRPDAFGRPRSGGEGSLMFPQDFAIWNGKMFVLGIHGLLAVYAL